MLEIFLLTYNFIENTKECVEAIYQYTNDFVLTIVDNSSFDGTVQYLERLEKEHNNISISFQDKNLGIIEGRNYSYSLSKSNPDFVMFIDNDQILRHGWQKAYYHLLERYDLVGVEAWRMNNNFYPRQKIISYYEEFNYVGCGGMVIKKEVIDAIGLFDDGFEHMYFEDPDFCFRADKYGYKIGWCSEFIFHKPHNLLGREEGRSEYFKKNHKRFQKKYENYSMPVFKMNK